MAKANELKDICEARVNNIKDAGENIEKLLKKIAKDKDSTYAIGEDDIVTIGLLHDHTVIKINTRMEDSSIYTTLLVESYDNRLHKFIADIKDEIDNSYFTDWQDFYKDLSNVIKKHNSYITHNEDAWRIENE